MTGLLLFVDRFRCWRSESNPGSTGWHAALTLGRLHLGFHVYRHVGARSDRWVVQPWVTFDRKETR